MNNLNPLEEAIFRQLVEEANSKGRRTLTIPGEDGEESFDGICDLLQKLWCDSDLNGSGHLKRVADALTAWCAAAQQWQDTESVERDAVFSVLPSALRIFLRSSAASTVFGSGHVRPHFLAAAISNWWRASKHFDRKAKYENRKALQEAAKLAAQAAAQTVAAE